MVEIVDAAAAMAAGGGACHLAEKDYHADPCPEPSLSSSIVKLLVNATPAHAWHAHPRLNPEWKPDGGSRRTAVGSACHALLLGQESELHEVTADNYKTKAAREERDEATASGLTPILSADLAKAETIVAAARSQLPRQGLDILADGAGDAEVIVVKKGLDGWVRIKADWWSSDRYTVVDYKTIAGLASPDAFAKRAAQMDYDIQDAFYQDVIAATFPHLAGRTRFVFVVQEIEPPYMLSACEIAEADRTVAMRKVQSAAATWCGCMDSGKWPGYPAGIQRVTLPPWHSNQWLEREMEEEEAA